MSEKKNWNLFALQGHDLSDLQFREDMREEHGIEIPLEKMNDPSINDYVIAQQEKKNFNDLQKVDNPQTGNKYTPDEADAEARQWSNGSRKNESAHKQNAGKQKRA